MTAYNQEWLDALLTREFAGQWRENGLLSEEQWKLIQERNPVGFYSPNVFVRIGLAIFCMILLQAMMGLTALMVSLGSEITFAFFSTVWGAIWLLALERMIVRTYRHYGSGLDDMLLYAGTTSILSGWYMLLPYNTDKLVYCFIALPFLVGGSIRYLDRLMAAAAYICALFIVLLIVKDIPAAAVYLLPVAGMVFSGGAYFWTKRSRKKEHLRHWDGVLAVVEMLSILLFYISGNYWVVQQGGAALFSMDKPPAEWFFWGFTFVVPAVYIARGLYGKDRLLMDIGMGCAVAALLAFRYYFNILPFAWAATIAGAALFVVAYFSIRYLNKNKGAYTYEPLLKNTLLQKAQEQIFEQTIAGQASPALVKKNTLDGGQFGGGGAGGEF